MAENVRPTGKPAVIAALASGRSVREAACDAGVSERTVSRWNRDPRFRAEVSRVRREILDRTVGALVAATVDAVETLRQLLDSGNDAVRARAAKEVVAAAIRLRENLDLEERVAALEAGQERGSGGA